MRVSRLGKILCLGLACMSLSIFAQGDVIQPGEWLSQLFDLIAHAKGLGLLALLSGIVTLLISALKVSIFQGFWNKLGKFKTFLAPVLGLALAILVSGTQGFTWQTILLAITTGAGAIALHELLDALKAVPGLSPIFRVIIELFEALLGGKLAKGVSK